jgi:hypothetical protein
VRSLLHSPHQRKRSIAAATLGALALLGSLLVATPAQALNDTGTGGVFVPATGRFLDTGKNIGGYDTPMPAKGWRTIQVTGKNGVPDDGSVGAVSVVATAASISNQGILNGRPNADAKSTLMGIYGGDDKQNTSFSSVLAVNSDGTIQVQAETSIRLILDVQGYYTASDDGTAAGGFVPLNGSRIADTRSGLGFPQQTIGAGERVDLQVTGRGGIPKGASGAIINMIAVNRTASVGYLTPYATGDTRPSNSFNYAGNVPTSMQAQVKLSADGKITIYNASSTIDLVVDTQGYFTAAGKSGAVFTPGAGRAYDTRTSGNTVMGKNETRSIQIAGKAGVPVMGSGINAVVLSLTSLKSTAGGGSATVWADGTTKPNTTSINFEETTIRTNTITVPLGANGKIAINNVADSTNYVFDVQGWYSNPQVPTISCAGIPGDNSWVTAIPNSLSCSITAAPADSSNSTVKVLTDEGVVTFMRSDSATVTKTIALEPTAGLHLLTATAASPDGSDLTTDFQFGLGDWATAGFDPFIEEDSATSTTPFLRVLSRNDLIPADAEIVYVVKDDQGTEIVRSSATNGGWKVPAGVLVSGQVYSWSATVTGFSGGRNTPATVVSPTWTLHPDETVTDDYQQLPSDSGGEMTTAGEVNADDTQHPVADTEAQPAGPSGVRTRVRVEDGGKKKIKSDLLSASDKLSLGSKGYIRTAFSSVVTVNKYATQAAVESESGVYVKTPKSTPSKISLTDVYIAGGISVSLTIAKDPSVTISNGGKTVRKKITAGKQGLKDKQLQQKVKNLKVDAQVISSFEERTEMTTTFGSSTYSDTAG